MWLVGGKRGQRKSKWSQYLIQKRNKNFPTLKARLPNLHYYLKILDTYDISGDPYGTRTRVFAVKGRCPRPLDEGVCWLVCLMAETLWVKTAVPILPP